MKEKKEKSLRKAENRDNLKVNVHNDSEMVGLRLRLMPLTSRDPSIWTKTDKEKAELALVRRTKATFTNWPAPLYSVDFPGKLVVYLKGLPRIEKKGKELPNQFHSTVSHKCKQSDIADILARYKRNHLTIVKYAWNGRTYDADSLPVRLSRGGRVSA